jgi:hypothetical protein
MSVLQLHQRPFTAFDPTNRRHRTWYHEFVKHGTWGRCPVRFLCPDDHGDVIQTIQRSLIRYYVQKEFSK